MKRRILLLAFVAGLFGCAEQPVAVEETQEIMPADGIKARLQEVAASGMGGSALMGIRESLEAYKATDEQKANELLADLGNLEAAQDPEQVKRLASEMAAKL